MSCPKLTRPVSKRLTNSTGMADFVPFTEWMLGLGIEEITALMKVRAMLGDLRWQLAVQRAATRTDKPDAWQHLDAEQTGEGERSTGKLNVASSDRFYVRFGLTGYLSGQQTPMAQADALLQIATNNCGRLVGGERFHATSMNTGVRHRPVTGWLPAHSVASIMAVHLVSGVTGNFQSRLAFQLADTSTEEPGAWQLFAGSWISGATEQNSGLLVPTVGNAMWVRIGVAYRTSTTSFSEAEVQAIIAARAS